MKSHHWITLGTSVLAVWGWGGESRAAENLLAFDVVSNTLVPQTPGINSATSIVVEPNDHLLSFVPPPNRSETAPTSQSVDAIGRGQTTATATISPAPGSLRSQPDTTLLTPPKAAIPISSQATLLPLPPLVPAVAELFIGEENSLVAVAIGHAEGTRMATGERTLAYYGHVDPGNHAWNQGTFSYQQGARSPEEADQKQLNRLKQQTRELHNLAYQKGIMLTKTELLNGIDLANQAPLAALDRGYIDWLAEAKMIGLHEKDAVLWARTRSFLDPDTGQWNAPGLGNSVQSITHDQARRQRAITQVIQTYSQTIQAPTSTSDKSLKETTAKPVLINEEAIDTILFMDKSK